MMIRDFFKKYWLLIASGLAVIIVFQCAYGLQVIMPGNISWLMTIHHDWGAHYLGWYFYINEPWHFPLGEIHKLFYPVGTNVGMTDSIPLLAIFFKLFDAFLPEDFQYIGMWLLSCHLLAAYFTIRLFKLFEVNQIITFIAVLFIAANPVLIYRGMHPAICSHWLLIASIYLYFLNPYRIKPRKILLYQFILLILSAMINPYMTFMVLGFTFFIPFRLSFFDKVLAKKNFFIYNAVSIFAVLLCWYVVGMISFKKGEDLDVSGAYGLLSLNLNSLFNSFGFSTFLPQLKQVSLFQYEGFMYLGLGIIFLLIILLFYNIYTFVSKKRNLLQSIFPSYKANLIPLIILVIILTLFSVTHIVSLNDKVLFKIPIPDQLLKIGEILRASARFFWTPYYLIVLFCIIGIAKSKLPRFVKLFVAFIALIIQFYDTKTLFTYRHLTNGSYQMPIDEKSWSTLFKEFDEIVLYPPFQGSYLVNSDYQDFCYLAAKARKPITTGYVSRVDNRAVDLYTNSLTAELERGKLSSKKLYITTASHMEPFSVLLQTQAAQLNFLDNYYYLFASTANKPAIISLTETWNAKYSNKLAYIMQLYGKKNQFTKTAKINPSKELNVLHSLEKMNDNDNFMSVTGWAFIDSTNNNKGDSIFFVLTNDTNSYIAPAGIRSRSDVTSHFHKSYLDDAGFTALIFKDDVEKGVYELDIGVKNIHNNWVYQATNRTIKVAIPDYAPVETLTNLPSDELTIKYRLESLEIADSIIKLGGWAFFPNQNNDNCLITLVLTKEEINYKVETELMLRQDVTSYFKSQYSLDHSGFSVKMRSSSLPPGKYQIGIMIRDLKTRKEGVTFTDRYVEIH